MSEAENPKNLKPQKDRPSEQQNATLNDSLPLPGESVSPHSIEGLFIRALRLESSSERDQMIRESCGDDHDRIQRVTALLRAYEDAGSFLETPVGGMRPKQENSLRFLKPSENGDFLGTIGPYQVLETIGAGGMGIVMRAVDPKLNRVVAVKALLPELAANPNSRRRFLREAQAAAAVSHPHVVTIHAVDDSEQDHSGSPVPPYLVMECVVGQSLQQKLDRVGPLRLAEVLRISRQIGDGLAAAHKQGLIHRDIKPANILLENGVERVKITDFGLARAIDDITVTRTGEVCGTPQYMSPEQACGERVDHRSDLFSLGCVMYAMCTGHSPFRGDSIAHVIKRVTQDTPRPIGEQNPEIPSWLTEIIDSLLQKNPDHRLQTTETLASILDQHLSRIQHPTESGSHSAINERVAIDKAAFTPPPSQPSNDAMASDNVSMQFGATIVQVPAEAASHYQNLKAFARFWILLSLAGVVASLVLHPTLSLAANTTDLLSQAFQYPVSLFGIWIMMMLGTKVFRPNQVSMRLWALQSSSSLACMGLAYFWTTVLRMPFSGNSSEFSSRSLMGAAILPTMICVLYCGYVFQEMVKNPKSLASLRYLSGSNARLSNRAFLVLIASVLLVMGAVSVMFWGIPQVISTKSRFSKNLPASVAVAEKRPTVVVTHPDWGKIRTVMLNGGGSSRRDSSATETVIYPEPEMLGKTILIHIILMDGREWSHGFSLEQLAYQFTISESDLWLRNRSLVEVVEDAPGVKLRMVKYPSQKIHVNEFCILDPPFHKALVPGEHRIVLDYVLEEWELPEDVVQYNILDYRVKVLDNSPIKLSLKEIIEQHGTKAKTTRLHVKSDFKPLPKNNPQVDE